MKIAGIDKDRLREFLDIEVTPEDWAEFKSRRNGALLGVDLVHDSDLRDRYIWEEGHEFAMADFNGLTLYMAGTFIPRDPTMRSVILTGDVFLQEVDDRRGVANQILVKIGHRDQSDRIATAIDALDFPVKVKTTTMYAAFDQAVTDLDEMLQYAGYVIFAVAIVIFVGLANATSMAVRERVREVGVLRSLGFSRTAVALLVSVETLALALLGGAIGAGGAALAIFLRGDTIAVGFYSFPIGITAGLVLIAVAAAALVGLAGGLPAGIGASRRPIVDSLRSVD